MSFEDVTELILTGKGLTELPDLSEYKNLKVLNCNYNKIKNLDNVPEGLLILLEP
jgi:Leucine-rich repeat (LRR) protein